MRSIILIILAFGGGNVVGGAFAAFITLIQLFPRLLQVSESSEYIKILQNVFIVGTITFLSLYFSDVNFKISTPIIMFLGLVFGTFIGLFSSALAEVLNVIPILAKKLKIKRQVKYIIYSLLAGKVLGSIYFWTLF